MAASAGPDLLEREAELELLLGSVCAALSGEGVTIAVEGVPGIGKSALLDAAATFAAKRDLWILRARGGAFERGLPFGVVLQLFERVVADQRDHLLSGAAALAAPVLTGAGEPAGASVLHGLFWLTVNLAARRPLAILVDDAHWCDPESAGFLRYLARRLQGLPVSLIYAARPADHRLATLPAESDPGTVAARLAPAQLSLASTQTLLEEALGAGTRVTALARACHLATAGNPFYLGELARTLRRDPVPDDPSAVAGLAPPGIAQAVASRLKRLGPTATEVAHAVAVLGADCDLRHVAALAGVDGDAAAEAADALAAEGVLRFERPLDFVHPIVRTVVYDAIPPASAARRHRAAATLLAAGGAGAETVATHLLATEPGGDAVAVAALRDAAKIALARGASTAACTYLERARREPPSASERVTVLRELGSAQFRAARPEGPDNLLLAFEASREPAERAAHAAELAFALAAAGRAAEAIAVLNGVIAETGEQEGELRLRFEALVVGTMQMDLTSAAQLPARLRRVASQLDGATPGERLVLAHLAAVLAFTAGPEDHRHVAALAERALAGGELLRDQEPDGQPYYMAVTALLFAGRFQRADELFGLAQDDASARGSTFGLTLASAGRCLALTRTGAFAEALGQAQTALDALHDGALGGLAPIVVAYVLPAMIERDDLSGARSLLARTGSDSALPEQTICNKLLHGRARLAFVEGDPLAALIDLEELTSRDEIWGVRNPATWPTRSTAALVLTALNRREEALARAGSELADARRWGAPEPIVSALCAAAGATPPEDQVEMLREAVMTAAGSEARGEHARALTELGGALRTAGHAAEAREPLREALDLAHRCGAVRLARRARAELVATGARPRRAAISGAQSLTPSELRVARLAAERRTNREIAEALFVTLRTVEGHLTSAYLKLGVAGRGHLAEALGADQIQ